MDFSLTEEQQAFRESVRRWVEAEVPKKWARDIEIKNDDYPYELWDKLTKAGFHGIGIPEEYGGQGGDVAGARDDGSKGLNIGQGGKRPLS